MFKLQQFYDFCLKLGHNFVFFCCVTHTLARMYGNIACSLDTTLQDEDLNGIVADLRDAIHLVGTPIHLISFSFGGLCATLLLQREKIENVMDHILLSPFLHGSFISPLFAMSHVSSQIISWCSSLMPQEQNIRVFTRSKLHSSFWGTITNAMFPVTGPFAEYDVHCTPATSLHFLVASMRGIQELQEWPKSISTRSLCIVSETDRVLSAQDIAKACDEVCQDLAIVDMPSVGHDIMAVSMLDPELQGTFLQTIESFWQQHTEK